MNVADAYAVRLVLTANCEVCAQQRTVKGHGCCPTCGEPLPRDAVADVRAAISARRKAFKSALQRFNQRLQAFADPTPTFINRGVPLDAADHLTQVIIPTLDRLDDPNPRIKQLIEGSTWDPRDAGTTPAFRELLKELDTSLQQVMVLCSVLPPLVWRSTHRELVRAALALLRGQTAIALIITAPDFDDALDLQKQAQGWIGKAVVSATRLERQARLIKDWPAEEPFLADGSINAAAIAWGGVGRTTTSIGDVAQVARSAFAEVPGVSEVKPEHVLWLLPVLATSVWAIDHELLIRRAQQLRMVLDDADQAGLWVADHALLVNRIMASFDRIAEEVERMGREWRYGLPRRHVMRTATEVYRELVEGAFRDLGSVLLIAWRASRHAVDAQYDLDIVDGVKVGEIITAFE